MAGGYTLRETPGVTIDELPSGAWRVRWRDQGKQQSKSRPTRAEAEALAREVAAARLRGQTPAFDGTTVDEVFAGWLRDRKRYGCAPGTLRRYFAATGRLLEGLRELGGLPDGGLVPGSALTRDQVGRLTSHLRGGERPLAESTLRVTLGILADAWEWACDDPVAYPGLAPAPRDRRRIVPRGTPWSAPKAPTMVELDAVCRQLAVAGNGGRVALPAAVVMRSTGLRISQVLGIRVEDVNLRAATLHVRIGKSAREKADPRTVPIPAHLVEFLRDRVEGRAVDEPLIVVGKRHPDHTLRRAWTATTEAGSTRLEVWKPPGRKNARPDHAFRAGFQSHLVSAGVRDEVIDRLVGHANDLRGSHYVDDLARWDAMVEAVALIPPIDWRVEEPAADNVLELRR